MVRRKPLRTLQPEERGRGTGGRRKVTPHSFLSPFIFDLLLSAMNYQLSSFQLSAFIFDLFLSAMTYELLANSYQLPTTSHQLRANSYQLKTTS